MNGKQLIWLGIAWQVASYFVFGMTLATGEPFMGFFVVISMQIFATACYVLAWWVSNE